MTMHRKPPPRELARQDDRVGPPRYVVLSTPDGWQLLLEYADRYLRWVLPGSLADVASIPFVRQQAWPDTDVSAASLEEEGGALTKPALQRKGNEVGHFRNLRSLDDQPISLGECLDQGHFELEFDGTLLSGRWQLTRSGLTRREQETWTLRPLGRDEEPASG